MYLQNENALRAPPRAIMLLPKLKAHDPKLK
jgi:hypothetical protein